MTIRKAFVMRVNPDCAEEYERRHSPLWPELESLLKSHGVSNYSIFLCKESNQLFAYAEIESEELWNAMAESEICKRWWHHMADIMPGNTEGSPIVAPLHSVFHLD